MRKTIITASLLVILTLGLTQLATSQWKDNVFTNQTSGNLFVAFTTYRPASDGIPLGWRTTAWYLIEAGETHTFQAFADNPIYYLILNSATTGSLLPDDAKTYRGWMYRSAFKIVSEDEPDTLTPAADLLFKEPRNPAHNITENSNYFKSANTGSVTVTSTGVTAPLAELEETIDLPVGTDIDITAASGSTTLNQGSTTQLTISVTEDGIPAAGKALSLSVTGNQATISPTIGVTDSDGELTASLKINQNASTGTFNVTATISNTDHSKVLPITIEVGAGQISVSRSPSIIEPGQTSRVTFTVRTPGGNLFPNAQLSLAASVGNIRPTLVKTGSNGQATATYTADQYTSTPHPRTISTPGITATVVNNTAVKGNTTITVRYVANSLSVSGARSSITSGNTMGITATVKSRSGKAMREVSVSFSESSSYLRFSSSRVNTNSSGQASSTLRTGGKSSGARFTVSTSGVSSRSYTVRVNPTIRTTTRSFSVTGRQIGAFDTNYWYDWSKTVSFPGNVTEAEASGRTTAGSATIDRVTLSGKNVTVHGQILAKTFPKSHINVTVEGKYESPASLPGAPSLRPALRPETDQLSAVWQDLSEIPSKTALLPNYPNPFNPETWIPYHLAEPADVTLRIYAADGKLVRSLALGHQAAGIYENKSRAAYWDGRNTIGERVASGIYFYTFAAGEFTATGKMLILK